MPRGSFPPTPASSTDLQSQDGSKMASLQMSFELPPPAMASANTTNTITTSTPSQGVFAMQAFPMQASEAVKSRRRGATTSAAAPKDQFVLPPPPTRTRKIIQVKPKEDSASASAASSSPLVSTTKGGSATSTAAASKSTAGTAATAAGVSKRKQPSAASAAGRKIARKTAHSLIERRRRSKMNEEFAVLKELVPACTGEMHKLAILQASIEYVRYLEDCVAKLKAQCGGGTEVIDTGPPGFVKPAETKAPNNNSNNNDYNNPDVEMIGSSCSSVSALSSADPSPALTPTVRQQHQPSVSPAILPENYNYNSSSRLRNDSCSSVSTEYSRHAPLGYNNGNSNMTSPSFGPQTYGGGGGAAYSALTSPALPPQRDSRDLSIDQEATAALLMLNQVVDRRSSSTSGRGMSVQDFPTVDQSQQRTSHLCTFPRFPVNRQGESSSTVNNRTSFHASSSSSSRYSTPRTLPPLADFDLDHLSQKKPSVYPSVITSSASPPPLPVTAAKTHQRSHSRTVFTSATARPLRLVQESLHKRHKRRPTVFYATHSHSLVQSLTYITINQKTDKMASNPVMPKVANPPPPLSSLPPLPNSATIPPPSMRGGRPSYNNNNINGVNPPPPSQSTSAAQQDRLLADLRRQLDDSASDASSVDSRGRRRRRNNKQLAQAGAGGLAQPAVLPRLADTKPVRLQLGLNLDVEVELKARLQGDVSLTLL
ncbi:hypothetical protein QBC38DRAFT_359349 [Podospora fimiseda]|uniref:BHLH domain-containing protein n=1 Tax=Podospora fimiseda TaxID=252190 RepID=A0AAN7H6C7_9PEZI|nr:hypothetical protein QBC38DRAFT_359349 [Podospora fimiseda]